MSEGLTAERLAAIPIFKGLGPTELELLRQQVKIRSFATGDNVLSEGEANDCLLCILSGVLRVWRKGSPTDVVLTEVGPGGILGELTFIEPGAATATTTALEPGEAATFSSADFDQLALQHPAAALALYRWLALTLKQRLTDATTVILAHKGIQEAFSEVEELRISLGQLV